MTAFPDMPVHMDSLPTVAERAVNCWTQTGTNTGPEGTGQQFRNSGFEAWQIGADGMVSEPLGHFESVTYQHQLEPSVEREPRP